MNNAAKLNRENKTEIFSKARCAVISWMRLMQSHSRMPAIKRQSKNLVSQQWLSNNLLARETKRQTCHNDFSPSGLYRSLINVKTHFTKYDNIQTHHLRQAFTSNLQQRLHYKKLYYCLFSSSLKHKVVFNVFHSNVPTFETGSTWSKPHQCIKAISQMWLRTYYSQRAAIHKTLHKFAKVICILSISSSFIHQQFQH